MLVPIDDARRPSEAPWGRKQNSGTLGKEAKFGDPGEGSKIRGHDTHFPSQARPEMGFVSLYFVACARPAGARHPRQFGGHDTHFAAAGRAELGFVSPYF